MCASAGPSREAVVLNTSEHVQDGVEIDAAGATATAAQAGKIPSAQEALHARNATHRLVEVAARREGELAELDKLGNGLVGQEAARAGRAEGERRHTELLGSIDRPS
jgi:hypothetical protein